MVLCLALGTAVATPGAALAQAAAAPTDTISAIRVEGTQRIEPSTVLSYLAVAPGEPFDPERIDESLRSLFATGLFADVAVRRVGDELVVSVVENPIVNRIAFEGNRRIEDEALAAEVQIRPRTVYTRTRVQSDVERILEIYRRAGRFAATVEPQVIELDQNRVDLVFEIEEGPVTKVGRIDFVGNEAFSDARLREELQTRESRWWRFLTTTDTYDPDRLAFDRELLRRFYLDRGYADFRVVSAVAELTPDRDAFVLTFTVDEGERYQFGEVGIESELRDLDTEALREELTTAPGDWYSAEEVETSIAQLSEALGDLQYAFVDIRPEVQRNREERTIDLVYRIAEGPRVFVERIDIGGNVRTLDRVIRREMELVEGDPFNVSRLRRSEQRIRDLGFFERVEVGVTEGTTPEQAIVDVQVAEQSTGEITLGAGFSTTDGPLADFSIRERNLLGKGQDLRLSATLSGRTQEFDLSFTEPYFLERDLTAGFDLFHTTTDFTDESSYEETESGGGVRIGYPLAENLRQSLGYTLERSKITDVPATASRFIREQEGIRWKSVVHQELLYDRRDSRLEPTEGYFVRLRTDFAGLGGDAKFVRNRLAGGVYFSFLDDFVLGVQGEAGYIFALDDDVRIDERFFLGGDSLRGFETAGIGPRDVTGGRDDALGGNRFVRGSVELTFPIGLPEEFGVTGHAFTDFGTLGEVDAEPLPGETLRDEDSVRVAVGAGIGWRSPLGPIRVDFAVPVRKEDFDKTESFRFRFGTRF